MTWELKSRFVAAIAVAPDDPTDAMTQALRYLRDSGPAQSDDEVRAQKNERITHRPWRKRSLYSCWLERRW
jgi:hypothetical protein